MKSIDFFNLIRNKIWIFHRTDDHGNNLMNIIMGPPSFGFLAIEFEKDGNLSFPTHMNFFPSERKWSFDESLDVLELRNLQDDVTMELKLMSVKSRGELQLQNINDGHVWYGSPDYLRTDYEPVPVEIPSERSVLLRPAGIGSEDFEIVDKNAKKLHLRLKIVAGKNNWDALSHMFDYIVEHYKLRHITIALANASVTVNQQDRQNNRLSIGVSGHSQLIRLVSGSRGLITEYLGELLIKRNELILADDAANAQWDILASTILNANFRNRFKIEF